MFPVLLLIVAGDGDEVIAIDCKAAVVMEMVVDPLIALEVAVMVTTAGGVVPALIAVTSPVLLTVASAALDVVHVADPIPFGVLPSL